MWLTVLLLRVLCAAALLSTHTHTHCSITRNNLGTYKPQVIGLPILLFVTGVVSPAPAVCSCSCSR